MHARNVMNASKKRRKEKDGRENLTGREYVKE
jgi:hypothetical protein